MLRSRTIRTLVILISITVFSSSIAADIPVIIPNLHRISRWGQSELVELLLQNGADTELRDITGRTALHHAARYPRTVFVLLEHDADPNARDDFENTPLHFAVHEIDSVRLLIEAGADVNARNHLNRTALDMALRLGNTRSNRRTVALLLEAGAR
ncbi:ankyrin repeat domain-containing protein [Spirochaeta dissipatitropha]